MKTIILFLVTAFFEIAGCFAFWAWLRMSRSVLWTVLGTISLIVFALLLSRAESDFAGRSYAAYGGVYVASSLIWLWVIESQTPDRWDVIGAIICLGGASLILFGPRPIIQ
ncbi:YnfA family protein [Gimesia sp.]|uniref:YnfA family protein n=1 Tax=Gimesia TaxID=1649453 RepID=UPI0032EFCA35